MINAPRGGWQAICIPQGIPETLFPLVTAFYREHVLNIGQLFQLKGGKKYKKKNVEWLSNELHSLLYNLVNIA